MFYKISNHSLSFSILSKNFDSLRHYTYRKVYFLQTIESTFSSLNSKIVFWMTICWNLFYVSKLIADYEINTENTCGNKTLELFD